jgi:DNA repair protein SbcC/Rad50
MLSRLFKSRARFDDPDAEVRRNAVLAVTDEEARDFQDDLAEVARADADPGVRRAALSKLHHQRLEPFLTDPDPETVRAAAEAIARDIDAGALLRHPQVRAAAIRQAHDLESVAGLIGDVGFDQELIRLAIESRSPKVRVAVADLLMKETSLVELERLSRDKDKNVNRLTRSRLEEIKHARAELDKTLRRAAELTTTAETQLKADTDPLFAARLGVVKHDWHANCARHAAAASRLAAHGLPANPLDEWTVRFEAAIARADAAATAAVAPAPAARPVAASGHAARSGVSAGIGVSAEADTASFAPALAGLEGLLASIRSGQRDAFADRETIRQENRTLQDQWLAAADHRPPPDAMAVRFHAVTHSLSMLAEACERMASHADELERIAGAAPASPQPESPEDFEALWLEQRRVRHAADQLTRTVARIGWPGDLPQPARLTAALQLAAQLVEFDRTCHNLHEQVQSRLRELIGKLETQIEGGNLASAIGLEAEGRRLIHSLPAGTAKRVQGEFAALSARVLELKDWRTFATHPKREQFVAEMQALVNAPLAPPQQAERIRELREAWNELGPVTNQNDRRLFDRFNQAADTAFKPCRAYFDEQAATRKFNIEQRRKICAELDAYLNGMAWDHADWKAAEKILYTARDEWHKFHPVDRSAGRKLQTQFDALTTRLHDKLQAEWDRNVATKQAIIAEATAVRGAGADPRDATEKIKQLQRRWKDVGVVPRRIDQRLWKEFRAVCDEVFSQRDAVRTEQRQAVESQITLAEHLCDEFQRALEGADTDTAEQATLNEFANRFQALGDLPRDAARRVEQRFRDIERAYRLLLLQAKHVELMRSVDRIYDIDTAVAELEQAIVNGALTAADAPQRIAAIENFDPARPGPFADRLKLIGAGDSAGIKAAAKAAGPSRRKLAIEMEIAAGVETPAEFQHDRLALQVDRLNAGMKHRRVMEEAPLQIADRWCKAGAMLDDETALRDRFFRTLRIALE